MLSLLDIEFTSIIAEKITLSSFCICSLVSIIAGLLIALTHAFKNKSSGSFLMTLALIPFIVQVIIMLVNGNIGTGVAVAGAFALIRFRSVPGSAREITAIFITMAVGLATGTGFIAVAIITTVVLCVLVLLYSLVKGINSCDEVRELKIVIPEDLNYNNVFDDLFLKYTKKAELVNVKTTNMGSLFKLHYKIVLKDLSLEKEMIDELRCRNGNLDIVCGKVQPNREQL